MAEAQPANLWSSRLRLRTLLWTGFGGLLLLMGVSGVFAVSFLQQIEVRQDQIRSGFVERTRLLEGLRSNLYLSGTYARDFLLDRDESAANEHRSSYLRTRSRVFESASQYRAPTRPDDQAAFQEFRRELTAYFDKLDPVFQWQPQKRAADGGAFVQSELLPGRMAIVNLAGRNEQLNEKRLAESSQETSELFARFRIRLIVLVLLTLGIGLALAGASLWRILRLEEEADARFQEITHAKQELQDLSARVLSTQENERRKISRELHDEVGQSLWAVSLGVGNLGGAIRDGNHEEALRLIETIRGITESSARAVRNMSLLLRPSMLDDLGLQPALVWLGREVSRTTDLQVEICAENIPDQLPEEHMTCLYRVTQEALRNSSRHGSARNAWVNLRSEHSRIFLSVRDDGAGFDASREKGLGLLGMEERVSHLGGRFHIESAPGRGTTLRLELPLAEPAKDSVP